MGLKYYSQEYHNSDSISSDIDIPLYANTSVTSSKKHQYSSPSETSMVKNIYANISKLQTDISPFVAINSEGLDENHNNRIYENIKLRPIYINLNHHEDKSLIIPIKNDQAEKLSSSFETKPVDIETNVLEISSNIKIKETGKKFQINIDPNCNDKKDLYRTKIPPTIIKFLPPLRQRRTLHRSRRYRRGISTSFRAIGNSNAMRRSNVPVHHSTTDQRKHPLHKSVSNQLYNEIQQPILSEEIFEYPMQQQIISWHPTEFYYKEELIPQVFSTSENQDETTNEEEDFPLRRRSKSSSSTLASVTNTIISETISEEIPVRPPPLNRRLPDVALSLDKKDVDFIHDILQRSNGDRRESNRITALREAYIRAADKRNDLLKAKTISQINENNNKKKIAMKNSFITSKIRHELERYDELPIHRRYISDDDDDTYSTNDDYEYDRHRVPSTAHRILNFVTSLKRQIQKNFHDIRSRILIETMANSSNRQIFHSSSNLSHRHKYRPKSANHIIRRINSHHSIEPSYPFLRTHSNTSHLPSYDQHFSTHRPRTFRVTPDQQPRRQRMS